MKYRRERSRAVRTDMSEIYSPLRVSAVAKLCPSYGVLPGFALDLTTNDSDGRHWDFNEEEMRNCAWTKAKEEQPLLLKGSPDVHSIQRIAAFQQFRARPSSDVQEVCTRSRHFRFCCEPYE